MNLIISDENYTKLISDTLNIVQEFACTSCNLTTGEEDYKVVEYHSSLKL